MTPTIYLGLGAAAAGLVIGLASGIGGARLYYGKQIADRDTKHAQYVADAEKQHSADVLALRGAESRLADQLETQREQAQHQAQLLADERRSSQSRLDGVLDAARRRAATTCSAQGATAATGSPPADDATLPAPVLGDVLATGRDLAAELQASRDRGQLCEQQYDQVRQAAQALETLP